MGLINVDIDLLRTLIVVSETGSFTQAGERLLRTQSAISLQIKRLEEVTGETLVNRDKTVTLTQAGEMVRSYATDILQLNDKLVSQFGDKQEEVLITIGTPDDYAQLFLPGIIREFSKINSNVEFQIVSDLSTNLAKMTETGEIDIAFITRTDGINGINLIDEPLSWVARHNCDLSEDDTLQLAVFPQGCEIRNLATNTLNKAGRRWRIAYSSNQFTPLRSIIAAGEAIGVLPTRAVPKDLARVGAEFGLPDLPSAELLVKLAPQASIAAQALGKSIVHSLGTQAHTNGIFGAA